MADEPVDEEIEETPGEIDEEDLEGLAEEPDDDDRENSDRAGGEIADVALRPSAEPLPHKEDSREGREHDDEGGDEYGYHSCSLL